MKEVIKQNRENNINPPSRWVFQKKKHGVYPVPIEVLNFKLNLNWTLNDYKHQAHKYFDKIWKTKLMSRTMAYKWLSGELGINKDKCHFKFFEHDLCIKAIELSVQFLFENNAL